MANIGGDSGLGEPSVGMSQLCGALHRRIMPRPKRKRRRRTSLTRRSKRLTTRVAGGVPSTLASDDSSVSVRSALAAKRLGTGPGLSGERVAAAPSAHRVRLLAVVCAPGVEQLVMGRPRVRVPPTKDQSVASASGRVDERACGSQRSRCSSPNHAACCRSGCGRLTDYTRSRSASHCDSRALTSATASSPTQSTSCRLVRCGPESRESSMVLR